MSCEVPLPSKGGVKIRDRHPEKKVVVDMKLWEEIEVARKKIKKVILRTPMIYSDTFSKLTGREVFLKLENLQKTGSFKIRGAYYKLSQLTPSVKEQGVVAASA